MGKGWECPKCGACYAPYVSSCEYCVPLTYTSKSTNAKMNIKVMCSCGLEWDHIPTTGCRGYCGTFNECI